MDLAEMPWRCLIPGMTLAELHLRYLIPELTLAQKHLRDSLNKEKRTPGR